MKAFRSISVIDLSIVFVISFFVVLITGCGVSDYSSKEVTSGGGGAATQASTGGAATPAAGGALALYAPTAIAGTNLGIRLPDQWQYIQAGSPPGTSISGIAMAWSGPLEGGTGSIYIGSVPVANKATVLQAGGGTAWAGSAITSPGVTVWEKYTASGFEIYGGTAGANFIIVAFQTPPGVSAKVQSAVLTSVAPQ